MKKQAGFTLIELVVVVIILGLLAVTAIPRFLDLTEQAQQANIEGMAGGFATGVSLVRAQWEAEGRPSNAANNNIVNYDGTILTLTSENNNIRPGYPVGLTDGNNLDGAFDVNNCVEVWQNILQQPPLVTSNIDDLNNNNQRINYFVDTVAGQGNAGNALCIYYLVDTLNRDNSGNFVAPGGVDTVGNNFTYDPSNSAVAITINNGNNNNNNANTN